MKKQTGFTAVEIVLSVALVAGLGFIGVKAYQAHHNASVASVPAAQTPVAPQITSASDLNNAQAALDSSDLDASTADSNSLSSEMSGL